MAEYDAGQADREEKFLIAGAGLAVVVTGGLWLLGDLVVSCGLIAAGFTSLALVGSRVRFRQQIKRHAASQLTPPPSTKE